MPVYNGEAHIAETLDSLLAQTFGDFELIISDNASSDATEQICRGYAERDSRVRYVRGEHNIGASGNYRRALELSSCEYFRWANADDLFAPEGLARCVDVLDREPETILVYPKTRLIDASGQVLSDYDDNMHLQAPRASDRFRQVFDQLGYVNIIYGLMRTDAVRKTGLLRSFPGGDIPLIAELALYGRFHEIPEFLFFRRMHPTASSSFKDDVSLTQQFFDPNTKGRLFLREWQHLRAHWRSVSRAPLGLAEKLRLKRFLLRVALWRRWQLAGELAGALGYAGKKGMGKVSGVFAAKGK
jgi:glycosyltransferase involved in cell wall biosynthesis